MRELQANVAFRRLIRNRCRMRGVKDKASHHHGCKNINRTVAIFSIAPTRQIGDNQSSRRHKAAAKGTSK
jgi:hypothetical protein